MRTDSKFFSSFRHVFSRNHGCQRSRIGLSQRSRLKTRRDDGGFTLIEILVVVVILGILAAAIVPRIMDRPDQARVVAAKSDIRSILSALKLYRLDNHAYPTTDQGLEALVVKPQSAPIPANWNPTGYLEKMPVDPWRNNYQYLYPGVQSEMDVFSYGADGAPGGEGVNADIGSWNLDS